MVVWGAGFLATRIGLQYAAPFTFLSLRYAFGLLCLLPVLLVWRPRWPDSPREWMHVLIAGLLMHAIQLGGSHYTQYLGLSAGITALILSVQPLLTALIASQWMRERLAPAQWSGIFVGLAGILLVVWHKIDVNDLTLGSLVAVSIGLAGVTGGTLYQRAFCPRVDLWSGAFLQFAASLALLAPLAFAVEGAQVAWSWSLFASIAFLVILASMLAVNALHTLMRRGQATRVSGIFYLTPVVAVVLEYFMFDVVPSALSLAGMVVTCAGVALLARRK